ncbi:hypothetical protein ABEB36_012741 [Hypothenemus hampei]|uniref:Nuclease HARBI1 n=1 Tax=Hypothenemus hampei TaxID=57062 RepID=A0ABD1EGK1_HYPHA
MNDNDILPLFIYVVLEENERRNYIRLYRRSLRDTYNPFEMPDSQFRKIYSDYHERRTGLPLHLKIMITIIFLGRGSYQHCVGWNPWQAVSHSSVSRIIMEISQLITNILIVIDRTHVSIISPPFPGSVHDVAIYRILADIRAYLENRYENEDTNRHLIVVRENTPEARFNTLLKSARNTIERTNGILKGRFGALLKHRLADYYDEDIDDNYNPNISGNIHVNIHTLFLQNTHILFF